MFRPEQPRLTKSFRVRLLKSPGALPWEPGRIRSGLACVLPMVFSLSETAERPSHGVDVWVVPDFYPRSRKRASYPDPADLLTLGVVALFSSLKDLDAALQKSRHLKGLNTDPLREALYGEKKEEATIKLAGGTGASETAYQNERELLRNLLRALRVGGKTGGKWSTASRLEVLGQSFRASRLRAPALEGRDEQTVERIREHVNARLERCEGPKGGLQGQRKGGQGRAYGLVYAKNKARFLSPCADQGVHFVQVDLAHLMRTYSQCASAVCRARILARATGAGDFIQMPLLWWLKIPNPLKGYRELVARDATLRAVLRVLSELALNTALEASLHKRPGQDPYRNIADEEVFALAGHARHLLEAGLGYAYWGMSNKAPRERVDATVKIANAALDIVKQKYPDARRVLKELLLEHAWGEAWGLAETVAFGARTPLPREITHEVWEKRKEEHQYLRDNLLSVLR